MKSIMKKGLTAAALLLAANMANAAVINTGSVAENYIAKNVDYTTAFTLTDSSTVSLDISAVNTDETSFANYSAKLFDSFGTEIAYLKNSSDLLNPSLLPSLSFGIKTAGSYVLNFYSVTTNQLNLALNATAVAAVPEPETYALMGVGLLGLLAARRKKAQALVAA